MQQELPVEAKMPAKAGFFVFGLVDGKAYRAGSVANATKKQNAQNYNNAKLCNTRQHEIRTHASSSNGACIPGDRGSPEASCLC
jgi:hypothetical protein